MSEFRYYFCYQKKIKPVAFKGHSSGNSIGKQLHIIPFSHQQKMDSFVVSMGTEKAFDRVEWSYFIHYINSV